MRYHPASLPQKGDDKHIGKGSKDLVHSFIYSSISPINTCSTFPESSVGKESTFNAGDPGLIPGLGRSPGEGKGYSLQYSGLENSMNCVVLGVTKSRT